MSPLFVQVLGGCFAAAFLIGLLLNRRPLLVAFLVPVVAFIWLIAQNWHDVWADDGTEAAIYAAAALCGLIAAGTGSAIAHSIRLWTGRSRDH